MDLNSTYAPPINNACVPDIYSRLDADVIERTRVANNQLNTKLLLEQKLISKYKQEAERFLKLEKSRARRELARITRAFPTALRIQHLEDKLFEKGTQRQQKKNYLSAKNEDPICRRCYIHHLPTKKRFYRFTTPPPSPIVQDSKRNHDIAGNHTYKQNALAAKDSTTTFIATGSRGNIDYNDLDLEESDMLYPHDPNRSEGLIPAVEAFKFLEREKWGRERDLNHTITPRLMPNEIWKDVVKNISSQCSSNDHDISASLRHQRVNDTFFRGRTFERKSGTRSRRQSIAASDKLNELLPIKLTKANSRSNLYRRPSVSKEGKPNLEAKSYSNPMLFENKTEVSTARRSPIVKMDADHNSLSRTNSTVMRNNGTPNFGKELENIHDYSKSERIDSFRSVPLPPIDKGTVMSHAVSAALDNDTSTN